jgi:Ca2+-binding EF-hand superfamily protein
MLRKIKIKQLSSRFPNLLRKVFDKFDAKNQGVLSVSDFKSCVFQANLGFSMNEINRLTRYLDREKDGKIDYSKFLKQIEDVFFEKHTADDLTKFAR